MEITLEDALVQPGGGRSISYKGFILVVPQNHLEEAVAGLQELDAGERSRLLGLVNISIEKNFPILSAGRANQVTAMNTMQDVGIWFANEIVEGRQPLRETVQ